LVEALSSSKDFDDMRHKHDTWVKNLIGYFFMNYAPLHAPISTILGLVQTFLESTKHSLEKVFSNEDIVDVDDDTIDDVRERYQKELYKIYKNLNNFKLHYSFNVLNRFLVRLNYNN